ncbi:MAG TPA: hypothetical protein VF180_08385 [Acidimicrobiia bacterium]
MLEEISGLQAADLIGGLIGEPDVALPGHGDLNGSLFGVGTWYSADTTPP